MPNSLQLSFPFFNLVSVLKTCSSFSTVTDYCKCAIASLFAAQKCHLKSKNAKKVRRAELNAKLSAHLVSRCVAMATNFDFLLTGILSKYPLNDETDAGFLEDCVRGHNYYRRLHGCPSLRLDEDVIKAAKTRAIYISQFDRLSSPASGPRHLGKNY